MSKKILPYKISKVMTTYPYNAFYFGILEDCKYDTSALLIRDYLELYYFKKDGINKIDFRKSGLLEKKCFYITELNVSDNIIIELKKSLDEEYYAIVMMNQNYFTNEIVSTTEEYVHDWMIFGYDDNKKQFFCTSYVHGKIRIIELSYYEVKAALINAPTPTQSKFLCPSYFKNHLVKIKKDYSFPEINANFIIRNLVKVFLPKHFARDRYWHITVGLNAFFRLSRSLKKMYLSKKKLKPIFIQNIGIMCDFRQNVLLCLSKLNISDEDLTEYKTIQKETYNLLLMSYKYNCNMRKNTLLDICNCIDKLNKSERRLLLKIVLNYFFETKIYANSSS